MSIDFLSRDEVDGLLKGVSPAITPDDWGASMRELRASEGGAINSGRSGFLSRDEVDALVSAFDEPKVVSASDILAESAAVLGERASQRDCKKSGERSMAATVAAFNALTGHSLSEEQGWSFLIMLKLVRGQQGDPRRDDYVDLAAYGALLGECRLKHGK